MTVTARKMSGVAIRLPQIWVSALPRKFDATAARTTPTVLSRTPPDVDPDAPPMNMIPSQKKSVSGLTSAQSIELNPALRAEALWKTDARSFDSSAYSASAPPHSAARKTMVPAARSTAFNVSTTLESSASDRHERFWAMSANTMYESAPSWIKAINTRLTQTSVAVGLIDRNPPVRSKPALQNAATA